MGLKLEFGPKPQAPMIPNCVLMMGKTVEEVKHTVS